MTTTAKPTLPIRMASIVVKGYGRGSTDLGIPTANLDRNQCHFGGPGAATFDELPTGIYWGFCRIGDATNGNSTVYKTACSIGYNPTYHNTVKTVEPHLIAPSEDERRHKSSCGESVLGDFYGQPIRLSLVGYLRPELPFEGLEALIQAIKKDIGQAEEFGAGTETMTLEEKEWVSSQESI